MSGMLTHTFALAIVLVVPTFVVGVFIGWALRPPRQPPRHAKVTGSSGGTPAHNTGDASSGGGSPRPRIADGAANPRRRPQRYQAQYPRKGR